MIILHHLNNSRSQRILWMLEELELPYEIKRYERDSKTMLAPPSLRQVHPLGKSPIISDGEVTMAESGAIIEYLGQKYGDGRLIPETGSADYRQYIYWMHYAEGSLMPPLLLRLVFEAIKSKPLPFFIKPVARKIADETTRQFIAPQIKTHFDYVEKFLGEHEWMAGHKLTGADIQMSFPLEASVARGVADSYPNITAYVKRFQERPAYQRALQAGGDYDYA
ncbi:glutathione S-transferase [Hahella sp. CCB-MM4]|uniref:glutathione S-transferase family protein n=1 Tax=Hahella sp. (strain CCB-MM4) TaxID=1926491 RepID=UPI000B9AF2D1|nr:glutathione S-transferase [Hahella sp. CCB-MM4]OZG75207.1 glutathione S-transferase [Hahella sp. CCB-MM4]